MSNLYEVIRRSGMNDREWLELGETFNHHRSHQDFDVEGVTRLVAYRRAVRAGFYNEGQAQPVALSYDWGLGYE